MGSITCCSVAARSPAARCAAKLAHRFGINRLLAAASILAVGALTVALALSGELSIWRLMGPMVAYGVAAGLMFPLALTGATGVDPRIAGAGSAFIGFAQMACGSAGVFLVGQLDTATARPFAAFSLVAAVGGLLTWRWSGAAAAGVPPGALFRSGARARAGERS